MKQCRVRLEFISWTVLGVISSSGQKVPVYFSWGISETRVRCTRIRVCSLRGSVACLGCFWYVRRVWSRGVRVLPTPHSPSHKWIYNILTVACSCPLTFSPEIFGVENQASLGVGAASPFPADPAGGGVTVCGTGVSCCCTFLTQQTYTKNWKSFFFFLHYGLLQDTE